MPTITCSECETEFEQTHTKRMTCSPECAKQRHARLDREQKVRREEGVELLIPCVICGAMFKPIGRFRTCGDECSKKLKLETKKANKRKHYQEQKERKANAKPRQASVDMPSLRAPYRARGVLGKMEEEWTRQPTSVTPCEAETCGCGCGSVLQPHMGRVERGAFVYRKGHEG